MNAVKRRNSKNYNFKFTELNDGWFDVRYAAPLFAESYSFASPENGKAPLTTEEREREADERERRKLAQLAELETRSEIA